MEISGEVILDPDMQLATELEVEVADLELKPCGTCSFRRIVPCMILQLLVHTVRWLVSMHFEQHAQAGDFAWWRGLLLSMATIFMVFGYAESMSVSLAGTLPTVAPQASGIVFLVIMTLALGSAGVTDLTGAGSETLNSKP